MDIAVSNYEMLVGKLYINTYILARIDIPAIDNIWVILSAGTSHHTMHAVKHPISAYPNWCPRLIRFMINKDILFF